MKQNDKELSVRNWLAQEGYPLEFVTAREFRNAGLETAQGEFVHEEDAKPREVDVLSWRELRAGDSVCRVTVLVECKWSGDKPWLVFRRDGVLTPLEAFGQTISSRLGEAALWLGRESLLEDASWIWGDAPVTAFGGRRAFETQNQDLFYGTMQSVVSRGRALAKASDHSRYLWNFGAIPSHAQVVFPLIVIDGALCEVMLPADETSLDVREVGWARVHWRGSSEPDLTTSVDVVTLEHLSAYLPNLVHCVDSIASIVRSGVRDINTGYENVTLEHLPAVAAAERFGLPDVLSVLWSRNKQAQDESDRARSGV